jgi:hypothetical protein
MDAIDVQESLDPPRPRTLTVLGLLATAALVLSYLGAYALANALLAAEMIAPWPAGNDPRPRWLVTGFVMLMGFFGAIALAARFFSTRQLRSIEAMEDESP